MFDGRPSSYRTHMRAILFIGALLGAMILGMVFFGEEKMTTTTEIVFIFIGGLFFGGCLFGFIRSFCNSSGGGSSNPRITQGSYSSGGRDSVAPVIATINRAGNINVEEATAPLSETDTILYGE